jgi:methyl-accepting chemotaxis protein
VPDIDAVLKMDRLAAQPGQRKHHQLKIFHCFNKPFNRSEQQMKIHKLTILMEMLATCLVLALSAQAAMKPNPDQAIQSILQGNLRFVEVTSIHPHTDQSRLNQAGTQYRCDHAYAAAIANSDSRVPVERLFDAGVVVGAIYDVGTGNVNRLPPSNVTRILYKVEANPGQAMNAMTQADHETTGVRGARQGNIHGSAHGAGRQMDIKPATVKLADAQTLQILRTDWLKSADKTHHEAVKIGLSGAFWTIMAVTGVLIISGLVLFIGGTFNRFGINLKLYTSYGSLVLLALMLGIGGYYYVVSVNQTAHLETAFLDLDIMASEMFAAQDEFLLHGLENKAYGEKQVARIDTVLKEYAEDIDTMKTSGHLDAEILQSLEKIDLLTQDYKGGFGLLVNAFHQIEKDKEKLDKIGKEVGQALERMIYHHETELATLGTRGADMDEIVYQTRVVEQLTKAEILSLKLALNEVEFLLNKKIERVEAMEKEAGLLIGYLEALGQVLRIQQEKDLLNKIMKKIDQYTVLLKEMIHSEAVVEKSTAEMKGLVHEIETIGAHLSHQLEAKADGMQHEAVIAMVLLIGIALSSGTLLSIFIARSISRPINRIIGGLNDGAEQVASASNQVSTASQSLAEGASEQAASIEETSSSLEEISSMTRQNAGNANQADTLMKEANQVVSSANTSMSELIHSMEDISKASQETSKIIKTIDEIAFQTNLLALNAAVEAARAGEAGSGFAVVADEVRNLAMRAAEAAKNTAGLIEGTVKKVVEGGDLVAKTNEAFADVADSSNKVGELVGEIAAASNEQAQGIGQVNTAVSEMDKVTQQNAASAEESASASEQMSAQAEQMRAMVKELGLLVGGANRQRHQYNTAAGMAVSKAEATRDTRHLAPRKQTPGANGDKAPALVSLQAPETVIPLDEDFENF